MFIKNNYRVRTDSLKLEFLSVTLIPGKCKQRNRYIVSYQITHEYHSMSAPAFYGLTNFMSDLLLVYWKIFGQIMYRCLNSLI